MLARLGLGGIALVVTGAAVLFLGHGGVFSAAKGGTEFLAPRRLDAGALVSSGCCQFADHFQGVNWYDANVRSDFLANVLSVERRFFAAPGAAFDADSGMTYDGTSLDLATGDVKPDGLRLFSAPSKESLHISLLALALQKPEDVLPEHSQLLSLLYSQDEALNILEKKVSSLEDFDRRFPAFGGFLPWFCTRGYSQKTGQCKGLDESFSYIEPKTDPSEKISLPALDNGQMAWAITALVQVLGKRSGESSQIQSLAQRWEQRLQRMKDSAVSLFYDGRGTGTVRAIATLKDVHVDAAKNASNAYNAENFVLWDPFEGEMIVVFLDIFGNWSNYTDSQAEKDKIWNIKQQHVAAIEFKTTNKTYVIQQGFWFSSHEQWKILQLPYLEIPLVRQLFTNGELARLTFSNEQQLNGLLASVNAPIGFQCDSAQGKYCSALGIQLLAEQPIWTDSVLTPYGAFPAILIDPAAGLAWYHQMLRMPRAQTALGSIESFTQNGQEVAPIVTWDAKATSVLAMLGGTGQLVRDHLQQSAKMDNFVNRVQSMYAQIFEPSERTELGGSGSNTVLPMPSEKALPSDPAAPYSKCGCPSS